MTRDELINLVRTYFAGVDGEDLEKIFSTFTEDCRFSVETHGVELRGRDAISGMFEREMKREKNLEAREREMRRKKKAFEDEKKKEAADKKDGKDEKMEELLRKVTMLTPE